MREAWIGIDLDGTLAEYDGWKGADSIGEPIKKMVNLVLDLCNSGKKVKIFTARASIPEQIPYIKAWCLEHLGRELEVTCCKDFDMTIFYDDRAITVQKNTGIILTNLTEMEH